MNNLHGMNTVCHLQCKLTWHRCFCNETCQPLVEIPIKTTMSLNRLSSLFCLRCWIIVYIIDAVSSVSSKRLQRMKGPSAMSALSQITLKYLLNILTGLWSRMGGGGVKWWGAGCRCLYIWQKLLITLLMGLLVKYDLFKSQILNSPFGRHSSTSYTSDISQLHYMSFCFQYHVFLLYSMVGFLV